METQPNDKRRFQRVQFKARCLLLYHGAALDGTLETLSLNGAMVSFNDSIMVPESELCALQMFVEEGNPMEFSVEVIYSTMYRLHLRIVAYENDSGLRLSKLMEKLTPDREKLISERILLGWQDVEAT